MPQQPLVINSLGADTHMPSSQSQAILRNQAHACLHPGY